MKTLKPSIPTLGTTSSGSGWQPDSRRGNRHQRGYGTDWDHTRVRIRERAKDLCEPHLAIGLVHQGTSCDHKVPRSQGGTDGENNLHWVCQSFHDAKTRIESNGGRVEDFDALARATAGGG